MPVVTGEASSVTIRFTISPTPGWLYRHILCLALSLTLRRATHFVEYSAVAVLTLTRDSTFSFCSAPCKLCCRSWPSSQKMATPELLSDASALLASVFLLCQQREGSERLLAEKHRLHLVDPLYHAHLSESFHSSPNSLLYWFWHFCFIYCWLLFHLKLPRAILVVYKHCFPGSLPGC